MILKAGNRIFYILLNTKTPIMAVLKVIELLGQSKKGWEDASQEMVKEASKTIKNIRSIYVQEMSATVEDGDITMYRVNGKVTFEVK